MDFYILPHQGRLAWAAKAAAKPEKTPLQMELPKVTIQLPLYNEPYVVARLLEAVVAVLSQGQIRSTSTGRFLWSGTKHSKLSSHYQEKDAPRLLQRSNRKGFKAGALNTDYNRLKGAYSHF